MDVNDIRNFMRRSMEREREHRLRNREFRRHIRSYISPELWQTICDEWAKKNNKPKGGDED